MLGFRGDREEPAPPFACNASLIAASCLPTVLYFMPILLSFVRFLLPAFSLEPDVGSAALVLRGRLPSVAGEGSGAPRGGLFWVKGLGLVMAGGRSKSNSSPLDVARGAVEVVLAVEAVGPATFST